eukprot:6194587-Pleurochrysis_carterae.AAC.1
MRRGASSARVGAEAQGARQAPHRRMSQLTKVYHLAMSRNGPYKTTVIKTLLGVENGTEYRSLIWGSKDDTADNTAQYHLVATRKMAGF